MGHEHSKMTMFKIISEAGMHGFSLMQFFINGLFQNWESFTVLRKGQS